MGAFFIFEYSQRSLKISIYIDIEESISRPLGGWWSKAPDEGKALIEYLSSRQPLAGDIIPKEVTAQTIVILIGVRV